MKLREEVETTSNYLRSHFLKVLIVWLLFLNDKCAFKFANECFNIFNIHEFSANVNFLRTRNESILF